MVRYTENVGFDGVYYSYNAMNKIVSVHVVDPSKQHATWYTYDASGRVSSMATTSNSVGYGNGAGSPGPNAVHNIPTMPTLLTPPETRDISYLYDSRDAVSQTTYSNLGKKTVYTRNKAGWLMENKTTTMAGSTTYHHQRLAYDNLGHITEQYWQNEAMNRVESYAYDAADRLTNWNRNGIAGTSLTAEYVEDYGYDAIGNRIGKTRTSMVGAYTVTTDAYAYANSALYQRANWLTGSNRTAGLARTDANTYTENGGIATRLRSEDLLVNTTPFGRQTYETWSYDANNLVERYSRASVLKSQNLATGCYPDALTAPRDEWRYRYALFMEREQKRQFELSSGEYQREGLAWVYYGLGGDKKQLSVWNGVQGTWCLQNNHVFLWPVEYNSYGPMNTRIITRAANGEKETVFTDHLGSTVQVRRGVPEYAADQRAYTAYGESMEVPNDPLIGRTGYIGRETDKESELGFYGVRQYDAGYGRFLSTDPLWQKYAALTTYHYAKNNPITQLDDNGKDVTVYTERIPASTFSKSQGNFLGFLIANLAVPRHTFMRVKTKERDVLIELGGPLEGSTRGRPMMKKFSQSDLDSRSDVEQQPVKRPPGESPSDLSSEKFEHDILQKFEEVSNAIPDYDGYDGPNSNGFILYLIVKAGGEVILPVEAYGKNTIKPYDEEISKKKIKENTPIGTSKLVPEP